MTVQQQPVSQSERKRFPDGFRVLQGKQEFITYLEHSSIRVWPSDQAGHFESHVHSAVEIILPQRGTSIYRLPEHEYHVGPDEILFIPQNQLHELVEGDDTLRYLILFEPDPLYSLQDMQQVSRIVTRPIYLQDQSAVHTQVKRLLLQLVDCYFQHQPMWNTQCYACLLQVYALITAQYVPFPVADEDESHRSIDPEIMNMTINYLSNHFMEDVSLEEAAAFAGYSKYYFSRVFKSYFGISFSDYLLVKRVNEAASLLIHSDKSIGDVAVSAGFGSIATFNRIFRKHKNCTPSRYRAIYSERLLKDGVW